MLNRDPIPTLDEMELADLVMLTAATLGCSAERLHQQAVKKDIDIRDMCLLLMRPLAGFRKTET